jgi:hypothetical protein
MTGERKVYKGCEHNRMRTMTKRKDLNRQGLSHATTTQWAKMRRFYNICRIDFESRYTINDYREKENDVSWVEVDNYESILSSRKTMHTGEGCGDDVGIGDSAMNVYGDLKMMRIYSNGDESFLDESDDEFNRRQFRLSQWLKNKRNREDSKYKKIVGV